jgi:hypothetical protein
LDRIRGDDVASGNICADAATIPTPEYGNTAEAAGTTSAARNHNATGGRPSVEAGRSVSAQ